MGLSLNPLSMRAIGGARGNRKPASKWPMDRVQNPTGGVCMRSNDLGIKTSKSCGIKYFSFIWEMDCFTLLTTPIQGLLSKDCWYLTYLGVSSSDGLLEGFDLDCDLDLDLDLPIEGPSSLCKGEVAEIEKEKLELMEDMVPCRGRGGRSLGVWQRSRRRNNGTGEF